MFEFMLVLDDLHTLCGPRRWQGRVEQLELLCNARQVSRKLQIAETMQMCAMDGPRRSRYHVNAKVGPGGLKYQIDNLVTECDLAVVYAIHEKFFEV